MASTLPSLSSCCCHLGRRRGDRRRCRKLCFELGCHRRRSCRSRRSERLVCPHLYSRFGCFDLLHFIRAMSQPASVGGDGEPRHVDFQARPSRKRGNYGPGHRAASSLPTCLRTLLAGCRAGSLRLRLGVRRPSFPYHHPDAPGLAPPTALPLSFSPALFQCLCHTEGEVFS